MRVLLRQEPAHEIDPRPGHRGAADLAALTVRPGRRRSRLAAAAGGAARARRAAGAPPGAAPPRRLTELAGEELVTTPPGFGYRALVDGLLREAGVAPAVSFESQDLATIEGLVAAGLGVAVLPEPLAGVSGTVGGPSSEAARRTIGLCWRTDRELPPPARRFRDVVRAWSHASQGRDGADSSHEHR